MAGVGEALAIIALVEPAFKTCLETHGYYKLTKNFGEDFQKAERRLRGQAARLKVLGDTKTSHLLTALEDGTELASTVKWTLQEMRKNFDRCELLMKKHGEPETPRRKLVKRPISSYQATSPVSPVSSDHLSPLGSPSTKRSKLSFSLRHKPSSSTSGSSVSYSMTPLGSDTEATSVTSPSSLGMLYDSSITRGIEEDTVRAQSLQSSSSLFARLKWATEDRSQFFSYLEELTRANDLLESLLRIRSLNDEDLFQGDSKISPQAHQTLSDTQAALEVLHHQLLDANPNGRGIDFSLKLALDSTDKETYADYVVMSIRSEHEK